jgi:hypothetical protein
MLQAATDHQAKSQDRVKNFLQGAKYLAEKNRARKKNRLNRVEGVVVKHLREHRN